LTVLSRTAKLGIAAETVKAQYAPPAFTVVYSRPATYRQVIAPLRDTALRGEGTWLEDAQQGPWHTEWSVPSPCYPDLAGWYLRAIIGADTCTPGVTTTLAAAATAGATTASLGARPANGTVLMIGAGDTLEYASIGTPTGTGPYTCPLASPLLYSHAPGEPVLSQATHVFTQQMCAGFPCYSLTMDDGTGPLGFPGCVMSSLKITIDATGYARLTANWTGFPASPVSTFAYDASPAQPMAGWDWVIAQSSGVTPVPYFARVPGPTARPLTYGDSSIASTRGQKLELTLSRDTAPCNAINGSQSPLVISTGPMKADADYTAIYENQDDLDLFLSYNQSPVTHALTQAGPLGGSSLSVTLPRAGWLTGEPDDSGDYLSARFTVSGIASPSPGPAVEATLTNFVQTAYAP
jgi:hypothetical protein